jgi:arabinogalactan oligomer/maltooligosaccharide transport system substrate-binding protein
MRKKLVSLLLCTAMAATMVTGCGSTTGDTTGDASSSGSSASDLTSTDETVTLTLWGAEEDQDLLKELVDKFEAQYSDTTFDISIGVESESTAKDTILTDIEAAADVFAFASDQINDLVNAGALANLDDTSEALSVADKTLDDVKDANSGVDAATVDGSMYAFPMAGDNSYYMYYDSSVISEEDAASWDTLLAAAKKAGKKVGMTFNSGWYNAAFFYGAGFTTGLNEDGTTTIDWDGTSADGYKGTDVVKSMLDIAGNSAFKAVPDGKMSDVLASGSCAAVITGSWDDSTAQEVYGDGYAATKLPTFTCAGDQVQMAPAFGYKFIGVNAYSENTGWAVLLADFLTNEESQATRFAERGIGPTNKNVLATDDVQNSVAVAAVTSESDFGVVQNVGGKFWDPTATFGEQIAKGKIKASDDTAIQKALDDLVTGVTAAVD